MGLEIEEWEIWHTYTTYFEATEIDLSETARRLVAADVAECAMLRDGRTYWRSDAAVSSGSTEIDADSVTGESSFRLRFDDGCKKPEGFALEAWGQASYFLISERKVLGDDTALPPPYLRAYLDKCRLVTAPSKDEPTSQLDLYPVLILYESGVLIVEFRMIGPESITELSHFITGGVNLFKYRFDSVEVSPGLASFATRILPVCPPMELVSQASAHVAAGRPRKQQASTSNVRYLGVKCGK